MAEKAAFKNARHEPALPFINMLLSRLENKVQPERAEAIAKEIWISRPHLIGLQEVSLIVEVDSSGEIVN